MKTAEKLLVALVLSVLAGSLALLVLNGTGAGTTVTACVLCLILTVLAVSAGSIIISDRKQRDRESGAASDFLDADRFIDSYKTNSLYRLIVIALFILTVFLFMIISLWVGQNSLTLGEVFDVFVKHITGAELEFGTPGWYNDILVWDVRMPRAVVAIISGAGLAVAGAVMQGAVKNPLADPYTTGISSGAVFGATLFIVLGFSVAGNEQYGIVLNAFLFSLIPALVMVSISRISNGSPVTVILVGTAVSYIFSSFSTLIMMLADERALKDAFEWQVGSLTGSTWNTVPLMLAMTVVISVILFFTSNKLNLMMAGDKEAKSLGLNVDNYRMMCLILLSLMVASIVSYIGMIGFLGLIVPHIVRMVIGSDSRVVLPASAILGAGTMLLADILSRTIATSAIPVGVVLSFVGGPLFLLLVIRSSREAWSDE